MVKLVIYIQESDRDAVSYIGLHRVRPEVLHRVGRAIAYGQELPQGHGRLLDEKDVIKSLFNYLDGKSLLDNVLMIHLRF